MCLYIDIDAAYLVAPGTKSCLAGYFYLGASTSTSSLQASTINDPIHVVCELLKHVVCSAVEAETGGLYVNCQESIPIQHILAALNHPQPPTTMKTNNSTVSSFVNSTSKAKKKQVVIYALLLDYRP